jgi:hypothetical protein
MLTDPVKVNIATGPGGDGAYQTDVQVCAARVTDVGPGSVTRVINAVSLPTGFTGKGVLKISHSETKENPGTITDRTLIRLDLEVDNGVGVSSTSSVYVVLALPRVSGLDMDSLGFILLKSIGLFLTMEDQSGTIDSSMGNQAARWDNSLLHRVIAGEG